MKLFKIIGLIFSFVGPGLLLGAVVSFNNTNNFIANSILTQGKIVDIIKSERKDSDGNTTTSRYPVINFSDNDGNIIEFESSVSTSRSILIGEKIDVRYSINCKVSPRC